MHILHQGRAGKPRPYEICVCLKNRSVGEGTYVKG